MSEIEIPRPTSGDVLERILEDHRLFEDLLRLARRNDTDREAARRAAQVAAPASGPTSRGCGRSPSSPCSRTTVSYTHLTLPTKA